MEINIKQLKKKKLLIDWCLTPTLAIFQLYCGIFHMYREMILPLSKEFEKPYKNMIDHSTGLVHAKLFPFKFPNTTCFSCFLFQLKRTPSDYREHSEDIKSMKEKLSPTTTQQESLGQIAEQDETPPQETDSSGQEVQQTQQGEATSQQQEQPTQQTVE